jgi:hypothetical protein
MGALDDEKYISLETYRRNGKAVRTPVWFAAASASTGTSPTLYVYTTANSGKAKRIRRDGAVRVAPCDARGRITGAWLDGRAEIVTGEAFRLGMRLLDRKYWPWKQLLNVFACLSPGRARVVLAIRPA